MMDSKRTEISTTKDGITKRVEVEEVENGFVVCVSKYGDVNGKYVDGCKKWISSTNPLDKKELAPIDKQPFATQEAVWNAIDTL